MQSLAAASASLRSMGVPILHDGKIQVDGDILHTRYMYANMIAMEKIEDCVSFLVSKAAQTVTRLMRERLAPYGITPVQYAVLQALWERDGLNAAELCLRLVIDSATVTGVVDRLENLELIERRADPTDRRVNRLFLTREARRRRASLQAVIGAVNDEVARAFGADAPRLWEFLRRLAALDTGSTF